MPTVICPTCGQPAQEEHTEFGVRHQCCNLHSWSGKPLVSRATHEARKRAHRIFDDLWKDGPNGPAIMKRGHAYGALQRVMGLTSDECHMALMDEETALRVPAAVLQIHQEESERKKREETYDRS